MSYLNRFLPPLVLMVVIFVLSAQPDLNSGTEIDFVLRKGAHMAEFGLLWLLVLRAFEYERPFIAAIVTALYAVSDEFHQTFVEGRVGSPRDVLIDVSGVALAWLGWLAYKRLRE